MKLKILALTCVAFVAFANANNATIPNQGAYPAQPSPYPPTYPQQNYSGYLPQKAMNFIQKNYAGAFIKDIDFEHHGFEVELSNGLDVYFDRNGNFLGSKWD